MSTGERLREAVRISAPGVTLDGDLTVPERSRGVVLFAHGSGSSRHSARNRYVAGVLNDAGLATLLMDLLTPEEERVDERTAALRFDIPMLGDRVAAACDWLRGAPGTSARKVGLFGASTGAAAALVAAARVTSVAAVVSRGGRPDLAADALSKVKAPTLLIVGSEDREVLELNREAAAGMRAPVELAIVEGATHLFEERGALEHVASLAGEWFRRHIGDDQAMDSAR